MLSDGFTEAEYARPHAPIGLAIGAQTAAEIALSILAQIVQVKNARPQTEGYPIALLDAMVQAENARTPAVLATIVGRHGSTPREEGSKMLVLPDGSAVGSVGGGIMGVVPGVMGVAAFAPPLDDAGNSVKAQAALSDIVGRLNLNIFHPRKSILAEQA